MADLSAQEPDTLEVKPVKRKKQAGKKAADLAGLPVYRIDHYLSEEELNAEFGKGGWKQLPDAIHKEYRFIPARVEIDEHHIGVYSSKKDSHMVKAPHPAALLHGSLASPYQKASQSQESNHCYYKNGSDCSISHA